MSDSEVELIENSIDDFAEKKVVKKDENVGPEEDDEVSL